MIVSYKTKKDTPIYVAIWRVFNSFPKSIFKSIPVKFPFKYFFITVISTVLIWTILLSAIIYRNAYKDDIGQLADILQFEGRREKHRTQKAIKAFLLAPYNWISSNLNAEEIPHIYIDIKFKHYQKLLENREKALSRGFKFTNLDSYIPAKIRHQSDTHKIKLRLKGDQSDHWKGDKWSFRIHMKGKDQLFGMRRFSLQDPSTRGFEGEIIFFEALKREGILTPRYFFVDLTVNGNYIGVMAFEEHFSKELLESQRRKESVILKFDDSLWFAVGKAGPFDNYMNNLIKPFRSKKIHKSKELSRNLETATGLLRGFMDGTLSGSQVFDVELMGRYLAVAGVWGAEHPVHWTNIRFYYNPITGRLEPVGYDANLRYFKRKPADLPDTPFAAAILQSDLDIRPIYEATLKKLKDEAEQGITEAWVRPLQNRNLKILHKEYPLLGGINLFGMDRAASQSLDESKAALVRFSKILTAHLIEDGKYLELVNHVPQKIIVSGIDRIDRNTGTRMALNTTLKYPFALPRTPIRTAPQNQKVNFQGSGDNQKFKFIISAHIEGSEKIWSIEASPYHPVIEKKLVPSATLKQALEQHPFLTHDVDANSLTVQPGHWSVNEYLVVPDKMLLTIPKGVTLDFESRAGLIATGPVQIKGTSNEPVIMKGNNTSNQWQGIAILNSRKPSVWSNIKIENTTGIDIDPWVLTGGVNFYESDIHMENVTLTGSRSEDALNIVRSSFKLDSVTIKNTASDGFDSDFSKGTVQGGYYENIGHDKGGGDGIDVSGSEITVIGTSFKNISDKALSVGEKSTMIASDVYIEQVGTGAVSKDGSHLTLTDAKIKSAKIAGLMAFVKKPEYGPGTIVASHLETESVLNRAVVQKGSKIIIDKSDVKATDLDVKELYATLTKSGMKK